ncbi:MAG TPA: hypothetical protein VGI79_10790 [Caulobacteraceae bacterium]|jgi:hypothetical protein
MRAFSFFAHQTGCSSPTLMFEIACDEPTAHALARKALEESPSRLAIEIREENRLVFSVDRNGAEWSGRGAKAHRLDIQARAAVFGR